MRALQKAWLWYKQRMASLSGYLGRALGAYGALVARRPVVVVILAAVVALLCGIGIARINVVSKADALWVPQDSTSMQNRDYVESVFGKDDSYVELLIAAKHGGNIITPEIFTDIAAADIQLKSVTTDGRSFGTMCKRLPTGNCSQDGALRFWNNSPYAVLHEFESNGDDVSSLMHNINIRKFPDGGEVVLSNSFAQPQYDDSGAIIAASATRVLYSLAGNWSDSDLKSWMDDIENLLDTFDTYQHAVIRLNHAYSIDNGISKSITGDIPLVIAVVVLMVIVLMAFYFRRSAVKSRMVLGVMGLLTTLLGMVAAYGLAMAFGVNFSSLQMILPFIIIGLGVDMTFVLTTAWDHAKSEKYDVDIEILVRATMMTNGVSITVTSLTSAVAFVMGAVTGIPALQWFGIYACMSILAVYIMFTSFFVACMVLVERRSRRNALDCLPCMSSRRHVLSQSDFLLQSTATDAFVQRVFAPFVLNRFAQPFIILVVAAFVGVGIAGACTLKYGLPTGDLAPDGYYLKDFVELNDVTFKPQIGNSVSLYFHGVDQRDPAVQEKMYAAWQYARNQSDIIDAAASPKSVWLNEFVAFVQNNQSSSIAGNGFVAADAFIGLLETFFSQPQHQLQKDDVVIRDGMVVASRIPLQHVPISDDGTAHAIRKVHDVSSEVSTKFFGVDEQAYLYSEVHIFWEADAALLKQFLESVILGGVLAVVIVGVLMLVHPVACLLVLLAIATVNVSLFGVLLMGNLRFNSVSVINMIMAVGIVVDYTVYLLHRFLTVPGDCRRDRMRLTLHDLGPAVLQGGLVLIIAILPLAFAHSVIFRTFFKLLIATVLFGFGAGPFMLSVLLSWFGPAQCLHKPELSELLASRESSREQDKAAELVEVEIKDKNGFEAGEAKQTSNGLEPEYADSACIPTTAKDSS